MISPVNLLLNESSLQLLITVVISSSFVKEHPPLSWISYPNMSVKRVHYKTPETNVNLNKGYFRKFFLYFTGGNPLREIPRFFICRGIYVKIIEKLGVIKISRWLHRCWRIDVPING